MIKIQLTPIEELENPHWYVPDVTVFLAAVIGCWFIMDSIIQEKNLVTEELNVETMQMQKSYDNIAADLEVFKNLESEIVSLQGKLSALKQITVSKLTKYEPIVLLEHLQTLKPDGLWYEKIEIDSARKTIKATGKSFDPILVAEFMTSLQDTKLQNVEASDVRTQLYFNSVDIVSIKQDKVENIGPPGAENVYNVEQYPTYDLNINYGTREATLDNIEIN